MRRLALLLLAAASPPLGAAPPPVMGSPTQAAGPAGFAEVLETLRQRAPSVLAARARADAARSGAAQARRLPNPTAEVRAENWRSGMDASEDLDVFGTHGARKGEAEALARAAAAEARQKEGAILLEGARLYLAAARGQQLVSALGESRDALSGIASMLERRVAEGWSAEGDLLKLRAELARAEGQLVRARLERDAASLDLAALLAADAPLDPASLAFPELPALPDGDVAPLASDAARRRPDVLAALERLAAADEAVRYEKARRIPEPTLTAGYKRTGGLDTALAGLSFPFPIFDTNAAGVARAQAEARAAALDLSALERAARAQIEALLSAVRALAERSRASETQLVAPALGARHAARAAFREGASAVLPLVDAERVTAEAVREALDLAVDARMKALEARLALGQEVVP